MTDSRSRTQNSASAPRRSRSGWRPSARLVLILIPVHVAGFLALYFGMLTLVRSEILRTHTSDAEILLHDAVNALHPAMACQDSTQVRERLTAFVSAHDLLSLSLFDAEGRPLIADDASLLPIDDFLLSEETDRYWFDGPGSSMQMNGIARIVSTGTCTDCHEAGETVGAATMSLDLSLQYGATRSRLQRNLALLIAGWALVIGVVNTGMRRVANRSVAKLQSQIATGPAGSTDGASRSSPAMLDPVSTKLYESLRDVLSEKREQDERVTSRLLHTERLASLGKLTAGLAHEIKNPLAGIQGSLELLRDDCTDDEIRDLYGQMLAELKRVNGTIHSLLHFARPAPARRSPTDVAALFEDTVQLLRPGFQKHGINIDISVAPSVGSFALDRSQIRQVLLNLVHNAADAIGENGTISIRSTSLPQNQGLLIEVEDDGPGIQEQDHTKIFEPFHTSKFHGTGLGLAVARSLIVQHGGRLELRSEPGRGATFLIILPDTGTTGTAPDEGV